MEKYLERTKQPADLSPAPVCEYCGPKCLGGAAHFARSEDGAKQAIPASEQGERFTLEQVREAEAVCARLALKPKTPEERQKQAIISVLTFQPEYNDHPGYNPDPDKLADAIVAALKDQLAGALKAAEQHYPACAMGQNLALGEGTHLEGTAEHPRHEFIGAPQIVKRCASCEHRGCNAFVEPCNSCTIGDGFHNWQPMKIEAKK